MLMSQKNISIYLCVEMTDTSKQQTPFNNKIGLVYCFNLYDEIWYVFYGCSFFSFAEIIFTEKSGNALFFFSANIKSDEQLCLVTVADTEYCKL